MRCGCGNVGFGDARRAPFQQIAAQSRVGQRNASCWSTSRRKVLRVHSKVAVGDGAMSICKALDEMFAGTRHQRCWVHKTTNALNKFPNSMQPASKADSREIWQAETRAAAKVAMNTFARKYGAK